MVKVVFSLYIGDTFNFYTNNLYKQTRKPNGPFKRFYLKFKERSVHRDVHLSKR